ncbi:HNH homing endonuclease III [Bacillus phage Staley]|uniref:HNH homing endonuclease III n=1 Tax=Bacillus phage Staley TaxID=1406792 RepID=U5Q199_9CAUD|nr:HNH homing endonuclease III [Bacillus phage Staley]AGY48737.1 HNH homing endonuclease III [Bacillus phage Staley]
MLGRKRKEFSYVEKKFKERGFELLEVCYQGSKKRMKYRCPNHPHKDTFITLNELTSGNNCPYCSRKKVDFEDIIVAFHNKNLILLDESYKGNRTKMKFVCRIHNDTVQKINWHDFNNTTFSCKFCGVEHRNKQISGSNHYNYNPELTEEDRERKRTTEEYKNWRMSVFERDNYACQKCGEHGGVLRGHHKDGYHWCKERRFDLDNGVTLCESCHDNFHSEFGLRNNTEKQFDQWIKDGEE